jgi:hypothetical protein
VLDLFALDPALARHELAPAAFEALFAPRLLPVMRHFAARRASAAAAAAAASAAGNDDDEEGSNRSSDEATAPSAMRVLSLMSGAQAQEMRALEHEYEAVLDVNCRTYALYLKKILDAGDTPSTVAPPSPHPSPPPELVFGVGADEGEDRGDEDDAATENDESASTQSSFRYNVCNSKRDTTRSSPHPVRWQPMTC